MINSNPLNSIFLIVTQTKEAMISKLVMMVSKTQVNLKFQKKKFGLVKSAPLTILKTKIRAMFVLVRDLCKCKIRKNNKFYFTDIPISIVQFSNLLSTIDEQQFLINKIAEALFNKELFINHVSPFQLFKKEIVVKINDLFSFSKPLKYSA